MTVEIAKMLVLSSGHISGETAIRWMNDDDACGIYPKGHVGWFVETANANANEHPLDLAICISFAKGLGMDWIMLDRDGPTHPDLPTYVW